MPDSWLARYGGQVPSHAFRLAFCPFIFFRRDECGFLKIHFEISML
jgi:hypothetical protein